MKEMKNIKKKTMSLALSLALILGLIPGMSLTAYADETIYDPASTYTGFGELISNDTVVTISEVSGKHWYVIAYDDAHSTVTLLAKDSFGSQKFNSTQAKGNNYETSDIKKYVDGLTGVGKPLAGISSVISGLTLIDGDTAQGLSVTKRKGAGAHWWLCSPGNLSSRALAVDGESGNVNAPHGTGVDGEFGVRPALKLDLSKVAFDSESKTFSHSHSFTYSASDATITATCSAEGCPLPPSTQGGSDHVATLTITAEGGTYDGTTAFGASITDQYNIRGSAAINYYKAEADGSRGDALNPVTDPPKKAGKYWAEITLGTGDNSATAHVVYTIAKADITPVVGIQDWTYGQTANTPSVTAESNPGSGTVTYKYYTDEACTKETTSDQGATETSGVPSYSGGYWVKATVAETDNYKSGTGKAGFTIEKAPVTVSGITASDKTYDGTTDAAINTGNASFYGKLEGDTLTVSTTGSFASKDVGTNKTVNLGTLTLGGESAGNYKLAETGQQSTAQASITKRSVTVSGITASNKTYDGNTTAELTFTGASLEGKVTGDTLSVKGKDSQTGTFDNKDVGTGKTVTLPELALDGTDAGNYSIKADSQTTATADITQKTITVSSGITSAGKVYDGTTTAPLDTSKAVLTGKVGDDDLAVTANGAFGTKDVGKGKEVTISGFELTGKEKNNYVLADSGHQETTEGDITPKEVALEWTGTKLTYNGKAQKPKATATGLEDGDECTVTVDGEQTDANAKSGKDYYEAEAKALSNDNYKLPENVKAKFTIAPKELTQSMISLDSDTIKHDGTVKGPQVTMTDEDIMVKDEDYILSGDVSSSELGTHVITAEGKGNYTGSIETSWMMYSKKSNDQKEEGAGDRGDFEVFVDVENNSSDLAVDNLTVNLAKGFLTEEDMARYNAGENVLVYMIIKEQPKSETGAGDRYILDQLFRETGATDISWYDITVWKKIGNSAAVQVHDTVKELNMSVEVPDGQKNAPEGYTREFYMGRSHDGASKLLAQTSEVKVGFGSSKFSTYALAYKDTEKPKDDPGKGGNGGSGNGKDGSSKGGTKTGDPNDLAGLIALMLASGGALGAMGYRRRRENQR